LLIESHKVALSFRLLFSGGGFAKKHMEQIDKIAEDQYSYLDALPDARPTQVLPRRPGFVSQPQKSGRNWI
jgi:hypothetical protein